MRFPTSKLLAVALSVTDDPAKAAAGSVVVLHATPTLAELCAVLLRASGAQPPARIGCIVADGVTLATLGEREYSAWADLPSAGADAQPAPMLAWIGETERSVDAEQLGSARALLSSGAVAAVVLHVTMPGFATPIAPGHELIVRQGEDPVWPIASFCRRYYWDDSNEPALWKEASSAPTRPTHVLRAANALAHARTHAYAPAQYRTRR
jgi:hypothetical protein